METVRKYFVIQNIGGIDRVIRVLIGTFMLGYPFYMLTQPGATMEAWYTASMVVSIYPLFTAIFGYDPLYNTAHVKSCDTSERNQCGSFLYQVNALVGRKPIPEDDLEHELMHSHHNKAK